MKCPRCHSTKNKVVVARIVPESLDKRKEYPHIIVCLRCLVVLDVKREIAERNSEGKRKLKPDDYLNIAIDFMRKEKLNLPDYKSRNTT